MIMFASQGLASDAMQWTSSPMSNYSVESPGDLRRLSGEGDVEDHCETEYEDIAAATAWNSSSADEKSSYSTAEFGPYDRFLPWTVSGLSAERRPSIISISPRGSPSRSLTPRRMVRLDSPTNATRRGSESSLLGSQLSASLRSRRRSSNQSHQLLQEVLQRRASAVSMSSAVSEASSRNTERDWERDQIDKIRSMDSLGRRFSEVVEVVPRSPESSSSEEEEDRDYTPSILPGRRGAANMWSPDTEDIPTDDESEVQSLPPMATPDTSMRQPMAFSNFPLASVATAIDYRSDANRYPRLDVFASRATNQLETPSPEMAPAEFLRRLREPITLRGWTPHARPVVSGHEGSESTPLRVASVADNISSQLFRASRAKMLPDLQVQEDRNDSAWVHSTLDALATPTLGATQNVPDSMDEAPELPTKRGSFADGVEEFGFLASEISVGTPRQSQVSPLLTPRPAGRNITLPAISLFDTPPMPTPSIKFDGMAAFLGKPNATASAPASPQRQGLDENTPTMSTTPNALGFPAPPGTRRARPTSLQVMPVRNDHLSEIRSRPRSGGLAISNADLPGALNPVWANEWSGGSRFPSMMSVKRPTMGNRSVTSPAVVTAGSPRENRISRKPVPSYSPLTECDESHMGSPLLLSDGTLLHNAHAKTGSSSGGSAGVDSPITREERAKFDRREQRRIERKQCRRCQEKRALRLLTESIMMGIESTGSPIQAAHTHEHRHHRRQQHSQDRDTPRQTSGLLSPAVAPTEPLPSPPTVHRTALPQRRSLPPCPTQFRPTVTARPGMAPRSYSEMQSGPYPSQPRVTYGPTVIDTNRVPHHHTNPGPAISGPILISSTSQNSDVRRSLAAEVSPPSRTSGARPVLRRSVSTSDSRRQSKRGTFARLLHAFDPHHHEEKHSRRASKSFSNEHKSERISTDGSNLELTRALRERATAGLFEHHDEAAKKYFRRSGGYQ
jgi:hypothetical protein